MEFTQKIKIELPYDPAMPLLGYIQSKKNQYLKKYLYLMFTAALFTIDKTWRQPKCPLTDD